MRSTPVEDKGRALFADGGMLREQDLCAMAEDASDAVLIVSGREGRIAYANSRAAELFALPVSELQQLCLRDLAHPDQVSLWTSSYERVCHGGLGHLYQASAISNTGDTLPVEIVNTFTLWRNQPANLIIIRDIRRAVEAEGALRDSEERYRRLIEHLPDAVLIHVDGQIVFANSAAVAMLGATDIHQLIGLDVRTIRPPENYDVMATGRQKVLDGESVPYIEGRLVRLDGSEFEAEMAGTAFTYRNQPAVLSILRDVSARKQAETALRESEERYRRLVEHLPDAVMIHVDGTIVFANSAAVVMFGASGAEELLGRNIQSLGRPEYHAQLLERRLRALEGELLPYVEVKCRRIDGSEFWAELSGTRTSYQGRPAVQLVVHDVSKRKQAEEGLQREHHRLNRIVDTSPSGVMFVDANGLITYANEQAVQILGMPMSDIVGRRHDSAEWHVTALDGGVFPAERLAVAQVLRSRQSVYNVRYAIARPDGQRTLLAVNAAPLLNGEGEIEAVIALIQDITRDIEAEHKRAQLEAQLVQAKKMEAVGALAGGIAHEVRNPLGTISANAQLLSKLPPGSPLVRQCVARILKATERASGIIENVLEFARPDSRRMEPLDVHDVLDQSLPLMADECRKSGARIRCAYAEALPSVLGNGPMLQLVFVNLLLNACQAMPDGGTITLSTAHIAGQVEVRVCDTGRGIPMDLAQRAFDPFFTNRPVGQGVGLGLTVSYSIVQQHQGTIRLESEPGKGTTVIVRLPAIAAGQGGGQGPV